MSSAYTIVIHKPDGDYEFEFKSLQAMFEFADRNYATDKVTYCIEPCYNTTLDNGEDKNDGTQLVGGEVSSSEG